MNKTKNTSSELLLYNYLLIDGAIIEWNYRQNGDYPFKRLIRFEI